MERIDTSMLKTKHPEIVIRLMGVCLLIFYPIFFVVYEFWTRRKEFIEGFGIVFRLTFLPWKK